MRIPTSTYRLQLGPDLGFEGVRGLVPYLDALGISDLYLSPVFRARSGSAHGYDVVDPSCLNPELGSATEFDRLAAELQQRGMGLLLDVVPNHMAASPENPWWRDLLEHGPASPFAHFFDIDWHPGCGPTPGGVLLPILGDHYGRVLERGELRLALEEWGLVVRYFETALPLDPRSYASVLSGRAPDGACQAQGSQDAPSGIGGTGRGSTPTAAAEPPPALSDLARMFAELPDRACTDAGAAVERRRTAERAKADLWRRYTDDPAVRAQLDDTLRDWNGVTGVPGSFDRLDRLLADQAYRLSYWKTATEEINYRRFFDISDLVGVRVEETEVFQATHALTLRLVRDGKVTGLRIDHVDGLRDPLAYLERLQEALADDTYVVVEKVLSEGESLPREWPVAGTTGYEFLSAASGVFVDPRGVAALDAAYVRITRREAGFDDVVYAKKKQVAEELFGGEVRVLERALSRLAWDDRHGRDLAARELGSAIVAVAAGMPVYRTYVRDQAIAPADLRAIEHALAEAARRAPRLDGAALEFLGRVLRLALPADASPECRESWLRFVLDWQQFTGPLMAKGLEDSALYVYNRLISLNTVGSDPGSGAESVRELHRFNQVRQAHWPHSLNATSTHDTKRSEDVRMRIHVLSEIPGEWERRLRRWSRWNDAKKERAAGRTVPDPNEEAFLYQTLVGAWPLDADEVPSFRDRLAAYLGKAAREAKVHTSWIRTDEAYEAALVRFAERILEPLPDNRFLADFQEFQGNVAYYGALGSLGELALKLAAPGVPDFYQGTELWDFSLVDPDNRRPVDFARRARVLRELEARESAIGTARLARELLEAWPDGRIKLLLTQKGLVFRQAHARLFAEGRYIPLQCSGRRRRHVCAFAREWRGKWAVAVVPRLYRRLVATGEPPLGVPVWQGTVVILPDRAPAEWRNALTDERVAAAGVRGRSVLRLNEVLESMPVALVASE